MQRDIQTVKVSDLVDKPVAGIRAIVTQKWREKSPDVVWERTLKSVERRFKEDMPWLYVFWEAEDPTGLLDRGYKGWNELDYTALDRLPTLDLIDAPKELVEVQVQEEDEDEWIAPIPASVLRQPEPEFEPEPMPRADEKKRRQSLEDELEFDDEPLTIPTMQMIS